MNLSVSAVTPGYHRSGSHHPAGNASRRHDASVTGRLYDSIHHAEIRYISRASQLSEQSRTVKAGWFYVHVLNFIHPVMAGAKGSAVSLCLISSVIYADRYPRYGGAGAASVSSSHQTDIRGQVSIPVLVGGIAVDHAGKPAQCLRCGNLVWGTGASVTGCRFLIFYKPPLNSLSNYSPVTGRGQHSEIWILSFGVFPRACHTLFI